VLAVLGILAGVGCKAPPLAQGTVAETTISRMAPSDFALGPLDRLHVAVFRHPEHSTPDGGAFLDSQGRLDLPLVGPVELAGLTLEEARARITGELARFLREPEVTLSLLEMANRRFYLFGEVANPGVRTLDRPLTALQALSLGGGFRPGADRENVALLRGTKDHLEVYFFDGATPGPDGLVAIQPDDFLFVRLSGAGQFRDQVLPVLQGIAPSLAALTGWVVIADDLNE
jgi:protein involved in polysaccharide export with SLBB domain